MATDVKAGQQYVVDGAIFKCDCGSAPCQITAISNQKVKAQGKVIVTDKDVTFKLPSAPFVTCSKNTQPPHTCVYANGIWKTQTTVQQGNQNAIVEKSIMNCPVFGGKIECVYPGQIQSVSEADLAKFNMASLGTFPLAMEVSYSILPQEESKEKASGVNSISYSKSIFRVGEEITIHAFSDSNYANELVAPKHVNWVVTSTKEGEKTEGTGKKAKTVKATYLNSLMTFKQVCPPFKIILNEPGKYIIEGGSDGILNGNKNKTIVGYNKIDIQKPLEGKNKIPMYKKCAVELEIVNGNSITGIKQTGNKKNISDTVTVYVKQGGSAVFTPEFKLDYNPDFEQLKCSVTKQNGEGVVDGDYKFDEGGHSLTLTPSSAEVDYRITFSLYKKTDETIEETPMSEKSILVHSYNEAVLYAYIPGATKGSANGNTTLRRPGDTLIFTVKQKDGKAENLDKIVWNVKKDDKTLETNIKGEMILSKFKEEGVYTIEADLKSTLLSNGGVKGDVLTNFDEESANPENKNVLVLDEVDKSLVNEEGKEDSGNSVKGENHKERIITHKLKISRNEVTGVRLGATNGKRYVGVRYTIEPSFLFGDATFWEERNNVVYTCEGADAYCLKRGIFLATKPGDYIVKATLNGKECKSQPFTIQDATFSKWEFCDSEKKKISYIGRNMTFGINASVPAWAQTSGDEKKNNKEITVSIFCKNKAIQSFKTKLDEAGSFHIDNIDVEKDIIANAKNTVSFDGIQDLIITFVVNDYPSKIVKGLSISKVGHGLFSTKANLTVKTKPFIDGYFADKNGKKLLKIISYDNEAFVRIQALNIEKDLVRKMKLRVYENKSGKDPIVYEYDKEIVLNKLGIAEVQIPINKDGIKKEDHGDSNLPRLFYFRLMESTDDNIFDFSKWSLVDGLYEMFVYPKSLRDVYNFDINQNSSSIKEEAENKRQGKNHDSDLLDMTRSYIYQLKIGSPKKDNKDYVNTYNNLAPVVVGEDWEKEEKKEDFQRCHCYRDFSEDFVRKMILKLRGKDEKSSLDNVWEGTLETKDLDDKSVSRLTRELNVCFRKYGISKCIQKIAFLANVCVETAIFKDLDELPSNHESSKSTYKGRGLLQLTGEGNYKSYKDKTKVDVVNKPTLLSTNIHYAVDSACRAFSEIIKMPEWRQDSTIKWKDSNNKSLNDTALLIESEKGENASKDSLDYFRLLCQKLNGVDVAKDQDPLEWENRKKYYNILKKIFDYNVKVCDKTEFVYFPEEWHDPVDKIMSCYFSSGGFDKPYYNIFGYRTTSRKHQGVDLFAEENTPVYACLDSVVKSINNNSDSGGKIVYLYTNKRRQINIMKMRRRNYPRFFINNDKKIKQITKDKDGKDVIKIIGESSWYEKIDAFDEWESGEGFNLDDGVQLVYMHMNRIDVKVGEFVKAGSMIGLSGRTGNTASDTKAPHVHFEIRSGAKTDVTGLDKRVNPAFYLYFKQFKCWSEKVSRENKEQWNYIRVYNCDTCNDRSKCCKCEGIDITSMDEDIDLTKQKETKEKIK